MKYLQSIVDETCIALLRANRDAAAHEIEALAIGRQLAVSTADAPKSRIYLLALIGALTFARANLRMVAYVPRT